VVFYQSPLLTSQVLLVQCRLTELGGAISFTTPLILVHFDSKIRFVLPQYTVF